MRISRGQKQNKSYYRIKLERESASNHGANVKCCKSAIEQRERRWRNPGKTACKCIPIKFTKWPTTIWPHLVSNLAKDGLLKYFENN